MHQIYIFNRETKQTEKEKSCGEKLLCYLYDKKNFFARIVLFFIARISMFSHLYGLWQKRTASKEKIAPFVKDFFIDSSEFEKPLSEFISFNDFFIRKLKKTVRPVDQDPSVCVMPADGRCLVIENIDLSDGFYVKGEKFTLSSFIKNKTLIEKFSGGSLAIIRLAPVDYHRFHFPFDCFAHTPALINGPLFSVNPIALKNNISILSKNKRMITELDSEIFGRVLYVEIGATNVGSIHQTFEIGIYKKGEEKGYFSFGGSSIVLLFEKEKIRFDQDLIDASNKKMETKVKEGTSLGKSLS